VTLANQFPGEVTGAGGDVEYQAVRRQSKIGDGPSTPPRVETEGHEFVHQFIATGNRVEHGAN